MNIPADDAGPEDRQALESDRVHRFFFHAHHAHVEPMAAISNALNMAHRGEYTELQTIAPRGTWRESFWVRPTGFAAAP